MSGATLERRLANFRAATRPEPAPSAADRRRVTALARLLAESIGGEVVGEELDAVVRCEPMTVVLPLDREALARLPGQPPPEAPLVCLDTETTGLATATGTMAFLVGLGWWEGDRFRQAQLVLPDQPNEPALLALIQAHIPPSAWLVTYNGKGFDWPLLITRYRMARRPPPPHAGHLDLLPFVRRVFRHRMADARLKTIETELLGVERHEDVEGWQIPGRYLDFLRLGIVEPLVEVVRHNREDVRSLARLLVDVEARFADPRALPAADPGDLAGLARAYAREGRLNPALACLDAAAGEGGRRRTPDAAGEEIWWSPGRPVDYGGRPRPRTLPFPPPRVDSPWTEDRILVERARLLRRLGRYVDAVDVWLAVAAGAGPLSAHAWIEVAKLREHRLRDVPGAFEAAQRARVVIERRRRLGRFDPTLERALAARVARLVRRLESAMVGGSRPS